MAAGLKDYSTSVPAARTLSQIEDLLVRAGASDVLKSYDESRRVSAIRFLLPTPYGRQLFALPARVDAVQRVLRRHRERGRIRGTGATTVEQAERVAWRIIYHWLDAQLALIETEQATPDQVLLPYRILDGGETVYEAVIKQQGQLPAGVAPALLSEGRS